jgi:heat shock protein HslJ
MSGSSSVEVRQEVRTRLRWTLTLLLPVTLGAGCAPPAAPPAASTPAPTPAAAAALSLIGTIWRLQDLGGTAAIPGVEATLEFPEAGRAGGRGSCNRFFGTVEISGETIRFGPLAATKMACLDPAANAQEKKYLEALQAAERFAFDGPALLVYPRGNGAPLRFIRR